ncbi:MAG: 50S ribosomal protein L6 [Pseudomonadota bacterium]
MSRVAKNPINIGDANVTLDGQVLVVKGKQGVLNYTCNKLVKLSLDEKVLQVIPVDDSSEADALAGTTRANVANVLIGVTEGFKKVLQLVGVGYRANVQGKKLHLTLGFSHPVIYDIPDGITVTASTPTEIAIQGSDKQLVGQVAAEIRRYRPPEPYKGKGVRYFGELIKLKETKKK